MLNLNQLIKTALIINQPLIALGYFIMQKSIALIFVMLLTVQVESRQVFKCLHYFEQWYVAYNLRGLTMKE